MDLENEYRYNQKFKDYVEKYRKDRGITVEEALKHQQVKDVCRHYSDV